MADGSFIEVCGLHLDADPHADGTYLAALRSASSALVRARGSDFAKITNPRKNRMQDHIYTGRILIWTDIDIDGRWLDLSKEDDLPDDIKKIINIPPNAKPNYRTFSFIFDESSHDIWFEAKSDLGERLGALTS